MILFYLLYICSINFFKIYEKLFIHYFTFLGKDFGIGVENLQWSGTIAGETSCAYQEIVTISLVTCRALGIGSYLVRLGQRVVQLDTSNIVLTGYAALNKVI